MNLLAHNRTKAFLIDLDGVLYVGKKPIQGVKECLDAITDRGYNFRFVSNSTRRCRSSVKERLRGLGYDVTERSIFTPSLAAIDHMKRTGKNKCFLLSSGDVHRDFEDAEIQILDKDVDYVVIGDAGYNFTFEKLNQALRLVLDGAEMLALEKDRFWMETEGLVLSTGPFVAALEYATGKKASLMGKPSQSFFNMALNDMNIDPSSAAMIGDDIETDVGGAKAAGIAGILVKTGKYREDLFKKSGINPDLVLESLAQLVDYI